MEQWVHMCEWENGDVFRDVQKEWKG